MIILTRLGSGQQVAVNPDLIERAEPTPDTVITLVDGHKLVVAEPLDQVVGRIRSWRAAVAAEAVVLARLSTTQPTPDDVQDAVVAERADRVSPLGRLLRLPDREV